MVTDEPSCWASERATIGCILGYDASSVINSNIFRWYYSQWRITFAPASRNAFQVTPDQTTSSKWLPKSANPLLPNHQHLPTLRHRLIFLLGHRPTLITNAGKLGPTHPRNFLLRRLPRLRPIKTLLRKGYRSNPPIKINYQLPLPKNLGNHVPISQSSHLPALFLKSLLGRTPLVLIRLEGRGRI